MTLRIGIIGLGGIAQKVYLPLLSEAARWRLVGAFSPNQPWARLLCDHYRIPCFARIDELAQQCDALFVHSSPESHYDVVSDLLQRGRHVYVDKPLAATLALVEQLLTLAARHQRILMVGFNRRFAPLYQRLKQDMQHCASRRMDKPRGDSVGPQDVRFTLLLDDYLHVVDTALWLAGGTPTLSGGLVQAKCGRPAAVRRARFSLRRLSGHHRHAPSGGQPAGNRHRRHPWGALSGRRDAPFPVGTCGHDRGIAGPAWQTILTQRSFTGAVEHFIDCAANQTPTCLSGEESISAQRWIERLLAERGA